MTERRQFLKAGAALAAVGPALARADERPHLWQGHDFGPGPGRLRSAGPGPLRHRAGRGLVHDRHHDARPRPRPQPRPRPRRLRVGGERPVARGASGTGDARAVGRGARRAALRGRALHPLRLARRAEPPGPARPPPGLGPHPRRRPPPRPARGLPRAALEPGDPAREARPSRLPAGEGAARHDPAARRREPRPGRATLRPPRVPAGLPRAQRAARGRARRRPARRVRRPDDVRLLGRGAHERLPEPAPGPRAGRAHVRGHDRAARSTPGVASRSS